MRGLVPIHIFPAHKAPYKKRSNEISEGVATENNQSTVGAIRSVTVVGALMRALIAVRAVRKECAVKRERMVKASRAQ
jgi:hypothetical protein